MSLLMDALKRAERARQAQAEQEGRSRDTEVTEGFRLDPIEAREEEGALTRADTLDLPGEAPGDLSQEFELVDDPRSLLDTDPDQVPPGRSRDEEADDTGIEFYISPELEETAVSTGRGRPPAGTPVTDTSATLPSIRAAQASVEEYFDGAQSGASSPGERRGPRAPSPAGTSAAEQARADTGPQRTARVMFEAKHRRRRGASWVVLALVPFLLLGAVAAGGYYYWDQLVNTFVGSSQFAPARPPPPPRAEVAPAPAASPASVSPDAPLASAPAPLSAAPAGAPADVSAAALAEPEPATPLRGDLSPGAQAVEPDPPAPPAPPAVAEVLQAPEIPLPPGIDVSEQLRRAIGEAGIVPLDGGPPAGIRISRRASAPRVDPGLTRGYEALMAGDATTAARAYREVLARDRNQRDALLGLAAVAVRDQRFDEAAELYLRLLGLNPRDSAAQAALISLQDNLDPLAVESRVKSLLAEEPGAAHLHFSLGNLYAQQGRWSEAQRAYFDAYRLDSENADYAFNLAVSLDRLFQERIALDYYRRALELSAHRHSSFAREAVERRIRSITARAATG